MRQVVPGADVVVTNPTHVAVAIKYDADEDGLIDSAEKKIIVGQINCER